MRFSLNTIGLFPGLSFEQIFPRMRQSGFDTFELWSLENVDTAALRQAMGRHGVRLSAFCPSFFVLNDPARQEEYIASLRRALALAQELSCPALITQVGQDTGAPRAQQHAAILAGLRRAAPLRLPAVTVFAKEAASAQLTSAKTPAPSTAVNNVCGSEPPMPMPTA